MTNIQNKESSELVLEALRGLTSITEKLGNIIETHQRLLHMMNDRINQLERGE
jgi:hypothetical protein